VDEKNTPRDPADAAHWEAVEEATELLHEERFKEALEALRDVITKDPTNAYAFFFLGQGLYEVGELAPSRDAYRAALKLAPQHLAHVSRSRTFFASLVRRVQL
jgi:cytochrome c-type biogenesis protein CcmH/NrfG